MPLTDDIIAMSCGEHKSATPSETRQRLQGAVAVIDELRETGRSSATWVP